MEFHHLLIDVLQEYFAGNELTEQSIRENFSLLLQVTRKQKKKKKNIPTAREKQHAQSSQLSVFSHRLTFELVLLFASLLLVFRLVLVQLLDEMVDGGFPLTTELNQLKDMILPPSLARRLFANVLSGDSTGAASVSQDLPTHALSKIPWRKADVKYVTNEIYFDLVESIDAILGPNNDVIHANIFGDINSTCRLSGMPDLTLSFTKPGLLEDVSLHRCVRINRYTREKVISFVPPDGQFKLMSYKISGGIQMPIYVKPQITYTPGSSRVHVMVGAKANSDKPVTNVVVILPFPSCLRSSQLTPNVGSIRIDPLSQVCRWDIGKLPKDKTPTLEGTITLPNEYIPDEAPTIRVEFLVKMLAASGLKVDGLAIRGVSYKPFKGIRSSVQAGKFIIRCNDT